MTTAAFAQKLVDDRIYKAVARRYGSTAAAVEAGFFDDGIDPARLEALKDPTFLTTPLDHLAPIDPDGGPAVVVLTTGGFAPVHEGHIAMMEAARTRLRAAGYQVLGGFMAPAHDSYVAGKGDGADAYPVERRLDLLQAALADTDWLDVDPWMALYTPGDLNFTDVIDRLKRYIACHLKPSVSVEIACVFGADNALFARAFGQSGLCVCVKRPGVAPDALTCLESDAQLVASGRVLVAEGHIDQSSRQIRRNALLSVTVRRRRTEGQKQYFLRDDLAFATAFWSDKVDAAKLEEARRVFVTGLESVLAKIFRYDRSISVMTVPAAEQQDWVARRLGTLPHINLDCVTGYGAVRADVSRLFTLSGGQSRPRALITRPSSSGLCVSSPAAATVIVDDDIASGYTVSRVEAELGSATTVTARVSLLKAWFEQKFPRRRFSPLDVVDARDFLFGARDGGLVVRIPGENAQLYARAPYVLPYVSLGRRAMIPAGERLAISREILRLNMAFFTALGVGLTVADIDPACAALMQSAGFDRDTLMADVCRSHLSKLGD